MKLRLPLLLFGLIAASAHAVETALQNLNERGLVTAENRQALNCWAGYWRRWICATYLRSYRETMGDSRLLPRDRRQLSILLEAYLIDKAIYEIGYELNNRPAWLVIPFEGILQQLNLEAK